MNFILHKIQQCAHKITIARKNVEKENLEIMGSLMCRHTQSSLLRRGPMLSASVPLLSGRQLLWSVKRDVNGKLPRGD